MLGRRVVSRLDGHDVRVLSRKGHVRGDLETGEGLAGALAGVDVVVHAATSADYRRSQRDVVATRNLLAAVDGRPHVVYVSIVGIDEMKFGYYKAKLASERLVAESGLPYTILRATQFHELAHMFVALAVRGPVAFEPRGVSLQPVDVGEVGVRVAELAVGEPAGRAPDMGGPRIESLGELLRAYLTAAGRRPLITLPVPFPGRLLGFNAHDLLTPDHATGVRTFADYLADLNDFASPYPLRRD